MNIQPLCDIAKSVAKKNYTPQLSQDDIQRKAASLAYWMLSQGRRSRATRRYFREIVQAYVDGASEASQTQEQDVTYQYNPTAIRQHVKKGHIAEQDIDTSNSRRSMYKYEVIFTLPISPRRGVSRRRPISQGA